MFSEQLYNKFVYKYLLTNETKSYNGITEAGITLFIYLKSISCTTQMIEICRHTLIIYKYVITPFN